MWVGVRLDMRIRIRFKVTITSYYKLGLFSWLDLSSGLRIYGWVGDIIRVFVSYIIRGLQIALMRHSPAEI